MLPAETAKVTGVRLAGHNFVAASEDVFGRPAFNGRQCPVLVPAAVDPDDDYRQYDAKHDASQQRDGSPHNGGMVARLPYAWRCSECSRILMRHQQRLDVIAALVGPLEIKCHCNEVNRLGERS